MLFCNNLFFVVVVLKGCSLGEISIEAAVALECGELLPGY